MTGSASRAEGRVPAANLSLAERIAAHLFVVCPNNSGSSFLAAALGACSAAWKLPQEGHRMHGYVGPVPWRMRRPNAPPPDLLWAAEPEWIAQFADPSLHNWPLTRKAWYFHAYANDPKACVFVTKSPPHVLQVAQLRRHFANARFLFMVRNPYAVCEGICRRYRTRLTNLFERGFAALGRRLEQAAARHVVACLDWQRQNLERHGESGLFFSYEAMCAAPLEVARQIRGLVPQLADLNLRRRLAVKDYNERLVDMNPRQMANLGGEQLAAFNQVFRERRKLLGYFGYRLLEDA